MKKTKRTTTFKSNNNRAVSSSDSEASIATNHILTTNQLLPGKYFFTLHLISMCYDYKKNNRIIIYSSLIKYE
ncbi:unnamed protein product [Rotaria magnacalcarata]|uniref:Uncharacterized protein n=1 Tax=Rotaria magnacalcarata TaxID=392030 RepID=A0A8S3I4B6_9BILA|nr:unnamed protein product [Rotaria magnacalcarata]CAF5193982.1 unnamed protein product [Rotaria magnacalcarata]